MAGRKLHFDLSGMSLKELAHLADALDTVSNVLSGLQEQPRFWDTPSDFYTKAGQSLEDARVAVGFEFDAIQAHAAKMVPEDDDAAGYKFAILAASYSGLSESPAEVVRQLANIAADIEWERQRARDTARAA